MDIYADVMNRLETLGVDGISDGDKAVQYAIERASERILNDINRSEIPSGLKYTFIDMSCGYYLHDAKAMGTLRLQEFDYASAPAKQIKEGEVQITFGTAADGVLTPEMRLDKLIDTLIHPDPLLLARYRGIVYG